MGAILGAFSSSRWLMIGVPAALLVIVVVVVVAASGGFGGSGSASTELGDDVEIVSVRLATIESQVPVNGSLAFPNKASLTFDSRGIVGDISVTVGQPVTSGQVLASFDALAIADLETKIAEKQIVLQRSQSVLDALRISRPVSVAQAETLVTAAEQRLDSAKEIYEDLIEPKPIVISNSEQALADAKKAYEDAKEALDDLVNPDEAMVSAAENRVANAKVEIDNAQEEFDDIKDGAFPVEEIRDAQNALNFATTQLTNAQRTLSDVQADWGNKIRTAQNDFDEEIENYRDVYDNWLGIVLTEEEIQKDPDTLLEEWGLDLNEQFDRRNPIYLKGTPTVDDPETRWNETRIWAWLNLYPSPDRLKGTCDDNQTVIGQNCISRQLDEVFEIYDAAQVRMQSSLDQAANSIDSASDGVTAAEDAVADAQEVYDEVVVDGPDVSFVEAAETRLAMALAALDDAEEDLAEVLNADQLDISRMEARVAVTKATMEEAEEDLDEILDPDPIDVADLQKQVELAEANFQEAGVNLISARRAHELDVELAQANVNLAQEGVNEAIKDREGGFIRAPFEGIVSLINVESDDEVNDESRILDVVDPSVVEVNGVVDAANIGSVREGSVARIALRGLSDATLNGVVTFVAPEPITESGVVSFPVIVRAEVPVGVTVPVTLNSVNTVIVGESAMSLLVPQKAIQRGVDGPSVKVVNGDGVLEERSVTLGSGRDGEWVSIRSGLSEGDKVVTSRSDALIDQEDGSGGGQS